MSSETARFFLSHPVFRHDEFVVGRPDGSPNRRTIDALLAYHVSRGNIVRLRRGLYRSVLGGAAPAPLNPLLVAARLSPDSVLVLRSALTFHGLAHTLERRYQFLTECRVRRWTYAGVAYLPRRPPRRSSDGMPIQTGIVEATVDGSPVRVTSPERTVVDVLRDPASVGGFEEAWNSVAGVRALNTETTLTYLDELRDSATAARVAFLLHQSGGAISASPELLDELSRRRPSRPVKLDASAGRSRVGTLTAWNVAVPEELVAASVAVGR